MPDEEARELRPEQARGPGQEPEKDYEAQAVEDAFRRAHDEELSIRARLAMIQNNQDGVQQMFDEINQPKLPSAVEEQLRRLMRDAGLNRNAAPVVEAAPPPLPGKHVDVDAYYKKLLVEAGFNPNEAPDPVRIHMEYAKRTPNEAEEGEEAASGEKTPGEHTSAKA